MRNDRSVDELLDVVAWSGAGDAALDWTAVEERLGTSLPPDYRRLMSTWRSGILDDFVQLLCPVQDESTLSRFVRESAEYVEYAGEWRRADSNAVPHPLPPEESGILPWAVSADGDVFFWLPSGPSPATWTIVFCDDSYSTWGAYDGTLTEFLLDLVRGRIVGESLEYTPSGEPAFEVIGPVLDTAAPPEDEPTDPAFWQELLNGHSDDGHVEDILGLVTPPSPVPPVDWSAAERRLGVGLPADYRELVDTFGAGMFGEIRVAVPGAREPTFDLAGLALGVHEVAVRTRLSPRAPYFPEPGGLLPWAFTSTGRIFSWAQVHDDPDRWPVVMTSSGSGGLNRFLMPASAVLLGHLAGAGGPLAVIRRSDVGPPVFVPALDVPV
ncbi:MAG: SMI1/KNR4 family protein [Umezawaea sp.]